MLHHKYSFLHPIFAHVRPTSTFWLSVVMWKGGLVACVLWTNKNKSILQWSHKKFCFTPFTNLFYLLISDRAFLLNSSAERMWSRRERAMFIILNSKVSLRQLHCVELFIWSRNLFSQLNHWNIEVFANHSHYILSINTSSTTCIQNNILSIKRMLESDCFCSESARVAKQPIHAYKYKFVDRLIFSLKILHPWD